MLTPHETVFARAGERVVTPEGKYICTVKNDLIVGHMSGPDDFVDWQYPKPEGGDLLKEGFRSVGYFRHNQVCIEGKWRP